MARLARLVLPGCSYHLTHRGNRGEEIFMTPEDRQRYLGLLGEYAERFDLEVWAYCLMTNHVHLIAVPKRADSLAKALGNTHRHYSRVINHRNGWTGHLWGGRYFSTPLDETHLWLAVRYVELNPVRAGIVEDPAVYPWSSAAAHASLATDRLLARSRPFPGPIANWREWLAQGLAPRDIERLRLNTSRGRPSGSRQFVEWLETELSRTIRPRRAGRPRNPDR